MLRNTINKKVSVMHCRNAFIRALLLRKEGTGSSHWLRLITFAMCLGITACVSHQSVESRYERISAELEPGDRVEVQLQTGDTLNFRVTEIRNTELVGETGTDITRGKVVTVPYSEISRLERVDQRPLVLIGSTIGVAYLLIAITLLSAGYTL
jgi:hypothetical protein